MTSALNLRTASLALLILLGLLALPTADAYAQVTANDADGDGISNADDPDDDNDRIPDVDEMDSAPLLTNASFESYDPNRAVTVWGSAPNRAMLLAETDVSGWGTTSSDNRIELWESGHANIASQSGGSHAEINATEHSVLFQDFRTSPGTELEWSIWHRGRAGTDTAVAAIGSSDGSISDLTVTTTMTTGNTAWVEYTGTYLVPAGQTRTRLAFMSRDTATGNMTVGNFIDNLAVNVLKERDTDNDGIPDHEDNDSDNDGTNDGDGSYDLEDAGLGEGPSCGATVNEDRLPRSSVSALEYASQTTLLKTSFDGGDDYLVLSGSWDQSGGDLRQMRDCGYDYTVLLKTPKVEHFRFEAAVRGLEGVNQGGIVFNQSSEDTRSGAMIVDLANGGSVLRWGTYDKAGYYQFIGSVDVQSQGTDTIAVNVHSSDIEIEFNGRTVGKMTTENPGGHVGLVSTLSAVAFEQAILTALAAA